MTQDSLKTKKRQEQEVKVENDNIKTTRFKKTQKTQSATTEGRRRPHATKLQKWCLQEIGKETTRKNYKNGNRRRSINGNNRRNNALTSKMSIKQLT